MLTGTTSQQVDAFGVFANGAALKYVAGVLTSANIITFTVTGLAPAVAFVATTAPQSGTIANANGAVFSIYNLRVNANAAGPSGTTITTTVGAGNGTIVNLLSGVASNAAAVSLASLASTKFEGYPNVPICNVKTTDSNVVGVVVVATNFGNSLTTDVQEAANANPPAGWCMATQVWSAFPLRLPHPSRPELPLLLPISQRM